MIGAATTYTQPATPCTQPATLCTQVGRQLKGGASRASAHDGYQGCDSQARGLTTCYFLLTATGATRRGVSRLSRALACRSAWCALVSRVWQVASTEQSCAYMVRHSK
eukprot:scaffold64065_cov57-Phaeocystis_antarctica.AAC.1